MAIMKKLLLDGNTKHSECFPELQRMIISLQVIPQTKFGLCYGKLTLKASLWAEALQAQATLFCLRSGFLSPTLLQFLGLTFCTMRPAEFKLVSCKCRIHGALKPTRVLGATTVLVGLRSIELKCLMWMRMTAGFSLTLIRLKTTFCIS